MSTHHKQRPQTPNQQQVPQAPMQQRPQAPMQQRPQAPMQQRPQAPMVAMQQRPQAPMQQRPQAPMQQRPQAPMQQRPQAPMQQRPQAPMQQRPQAPMQQRPQAPMQQRPQAPMQQRPQAPMQKRPQAPMQQRPREPVSSYQQQRPRAPISSNQHQRPQSPKQQRPRATMLPNQQQRSQVPMSPDKQHKQRVPMSPSQHQRPQGVSANPALPTEGSAPLTPGVGKKRTLAAGNSASHKAASKAAGSGRSPAKRSKTGLTLQPQVSVIVIEDTQDAPFSGSCQVLSETPVVEPHPIRARDRQTSSLVDQASCREQTQVSAIVNEAALDTVFPAPSRAPDSPLAGSSTLYSQDPSAGQVIVIEDSPTLDVVFPAPSQTSNKPLVEFSALCSQAPDAPVIGPSLPASGHARQAVKQVSPRAVRDPRTERRQQSEESVIFIDDEEDQVPFGPSKMSETRPVGDRVPVRPSKASGTRPVGDTVPVSPSKASETRPVGDRVPVRPSKASETRPVRDTVPVSPSKASETRPVGDTVPVRLSKASETRPVGDTVHVSLSKASEIRPVGDTVPVSPSKASETRPVGDTEPVSPSKASETRPVGDTEPVSPSKAPETRPVGDTVPVSPSKTSETRPVGDTEPVRPSKASETRPAGDTEPFSPSKTSETRPVGDTPLSSGRTQGVEPRARTDRKRGQDVTSPRADPDPCQGMSPGGDRVTACPAKRPRLSGPSGAGRRIFKSEEFYMVPTKSTRQSRRVCADILRPRHHALRPFQPVDKLDISRCKAELKDSQSPSAGFDKASQVKVISKMKKKTPEEGPSLSNVSRSTTPKASEPQQPRPTGHSAEGNSLSKHPMNMARQCSSRKTHPSPSVFKSSLSTEKEAVTSQESAVDSAAKRRNVPIDKALAQMEIESQLEEVIRLAHRTEDIEHQHEQNQKHEDSEAQQRKTYEDSTLQYEDETDKPDQHKGKQRIQSKQQEERRECAVQSIQQPQTEISSQTKVVNKQGHAFLHESHGTHISHAAQKRDTRLDEKEHKARESTQPNPSTPSQGVSTSRAPDTVPGCSALGHCEAGKVKTTASSLLTTSQKQRARGLVDMAKRALSFCGELRGKEPGRNFLRGKKFTYQGFLYTRTSRYKDRNYFSCWRKHCEGRLIQRGQELDLKKQHSHEIEASPLTATATPLPLRDTVKGDKEGSSSACSTKQTPVIGLQTAPNQPPKHLPTAPNQPPQHLPTAPNQPPQYLPTAPNQSPKHLPTALNQSPKHLPTATSQPPQHLPTAPNQPPQHLPTAPNQPPKHLPTAPNQPPKHLPTAPNQPPKHLPTATSQSPQHLPTAPNQPPKRLPTATNQPRKHLPTAQNQPPKHPPTAPNQPPKHLPTATSQPPQHLPTAPNQSPKHLPTATSQSPQHLPTATSQPPQHLPTAPNQPPKHLPTAPRQMPGAQNQTPSMSRQCDVIYIDDESPSSREDAEESKALDTQYLGQREKAKRKHKPQQARLSAADASAEEHCAAKTRKAATAQSKDTAPHCPTHQPAANPDTQRVLPKFVFNKGPSGVVKRVIMPDDFYMVPTDIARRSRQVCADIFRMRHHALHPCQPVDEMGVKALLRSKNQVHQNTNTLQRKQERPSVVDVTNMSLAVKMSEAMQKRRLQLTKKSCSSTHSSSKNREPTVKNEDDINACGKRENKQSLPQDSKLSSQNEKHQSQNVQLLAQNTVPPSQNKETQSAETPNHKKKEPTWNSQLPARDVQALTKSRDLVTQKRQSPITKIEPAVPNRPLPNKKPPTQNRQQRTQSVSQNRETAQQNKQPVTETKQPETQKAASPLESESADISQPSSPSQPVMAETSQPSSPFKTPATPSRRRCGKLTHQGYLYVRTSSHKESTVYFSCWRRDCKARLIQKHEALNLKTSHCHEMESPDSVQEASPLPLRDTRLGGQPVSSSQGSQLPASRPGSQQQTISTQTSEQLKPDIDIQKETQKDAEPSAYQACTEDTPTPDTQNVTQKRTEMKLDCDQRAVIKRWADEKIIINAGPGSGKTLTLCKLVEHIFQEDSARVLVLAFNRYAVHELKARLMSYGSVKLFPERNRALESTDKKCLVLTFHSFAYQSTGTALNRKTDQKDYDTAFKQNVESLKLKKKDNPARMWDWVIVDEGQDVTPLLAELVDTLLLTSRHFVVAGDPRQAIKEDATWFSDLWQSRDVEPYKMTLTRNHRSGPRLVEVLNKYSKENFPASLHNDQIAERTTDASFEMYATDKAGDTAGRRLQLSPPSEAYAITPVSMDKWNNDQVTQGIEDTLLNQGLKVERITNLSDNKKQDESTYKVGTVGSLKGTERSRVVLYGVGETYHQTISHDLLVKMMFVALSRAKDHLHVMLDKELPPSSPLKLFAGRAIESKKCRYSKLNVTDLAKESYHWSKVREPIFRQYECAAGTQVPCQGVKIAYQADPDFVGVYLELVVASLLGCKIEDTKVEDLFSQARKLDDNWDSNRQNKGLSVKQLDKEFQGLLKRNPCFAVAHARRSVDDRKMYKANDHLADNWTEHKSECQPFADFIDAHIESPHSQEFLSLPLKPDRSSKEAGTLVGYADFKGESSVVEIKHVGKIRLEHCVQTAMYAAMSPQCKEALLVNLKDADIKIVTAVDHVELARLARAKLALKNAILVDQSVGDSFIAVSTVRNETKLVGEIGAVAFSLTADILGTYHRITLGVEAVPDAHRSNRDASSPQEFGRARLRVRNPDTFLNQQEKVTEGFQQWLYFLREKGVHSRFVFWDREDAKILKLRELSHNPVGMISHNPVHLPSLLPVGSSRDAELTLSGCVEKLLGDDWTYEAHRAFEDAVAVAALTLGVPMSTSQQQAPT